MHIISHNRSESWYKKGIIDNNKITSLKEVIEELQNLINEENNVVTVEVVSVSKLTEIEKLSIINYFMKKINKKISLKETIDEKLVGGLVIKYQGKIIDGSLFTKQESLKEYLKK